MLLFSNLPMYFSYFIFCRGWREQSDLQQAGGYSLPWRSARAVRPVLVNNCIGVLVVSAVCS